jgi:hypothetical protein|tara:strand:+ start:1796 stop:2689 length:894 start_codon:yes stop_codon:yes gene_type:complete
MAEAMQQEVESEEVEIEIEGTETPEIQIQEPESKEETKPAEKSEDEEIAEYSESVKKRINKLTFKVREAERREKAAIEYAQNVQQELTKTNATLSIKDENLYDEYSARVKSQLGSAEDRYKKAHDVGDTDAMLESQKDVAKLAVELESLDRVKPTRVSQAKENEVEVASNPIQQRASSQPATPDPQAQKWASDNDWFGSDLAMTTSAFAFHKQLVEQEGFDPSSGDYYREIDKRMIESFPTKLGKVSQNVQENVAGSSRGARRSTSKGRTVKLTASQVAIAKKLGVPLEEYAKHVKV